MSELARRLGISQPSVSNWDRVPAERVLAVESITGVSRAVLRPDLYEERPIVNDDVDEVTAARAQEYALLAALLARAPNQDLLDRLAQLRGDPTPLGLAHMGLADIAGSLKVEQVEREFFDLFIEVAQRNKEAARILKEMFAAPPDRRTVHVQAIKQLEHEADQVTHEVVNRLDRTFITPLDREDIHQLASDLDDVMDAMDGTARRAAVPSSWRLDALP